MGKSTEYLANLITKQVEEKGDHCLIRPGEGLPKCRLQVDHPIYNGPEIAYGKGFRIMVPKANYSRLIMFFSGSTVEIGTSRTSPPAGSMGKWLQSNITKTAIASYVGPILINEGYAEKVGKSKIKIN